MLGYEHMTPVMFTDSTGYFWETISDIGFAIWGLVDLINDPTWENAGCFCHRSKYGSTSNSICG